MSASTSAGAAGRKAGWVGGGGWVGRGGGMHARALGGSKLQTFKCAPPPDLRPIRPPVTGPSSTIFWWRRCTEQSRLWMEHTLPCLGVGRGGSGARAWGEGGARAGAAREPRARASMQEALPCFPAPHFPPTPTTHRPPTHPTPSHVGDQLHLQVARLGGQLHRKYGRPRHLPLHLLEHQPHVVVVQHLHGWVGGVGGWGVGGWTSGRMGRWGVGVQVGVGRGVLIEVGCEPAARAPWRWWEAVRGRWPCHRAPTPPPAHPPCGCPCRRPPTRP